MKELRRTGKNRLAKASKAPTIPDTRDKNQCMVIGANSGYPDHSIPFSIDHKYN